MAKTGIVELLESGLKAETMRQQAMANNVANIQTPGYRRIDVQFEKLLAKALESGDEVDAEEIEPKLYQPKNTAVNTNGNDVNLEDEIGEMVKNSLRYKAFVRLMSKKFSQIDEAVNNR
ncbi:MAG: flagellar basal body rod protein FlgB [Sedimentisphaerales bacterium]